MDRTQTIDRVSVRPDAWDVVVIGGGATGVGCALDAASRGLDVLLLEQHDLGKGTSSRSTKLIHGGVRYLARGDVRMVREALLERDALLRNAPHIVQKLDFIVPCYSSWQKLYYGAGLKLYDMLAGAHGLGRSRILSRNETIKMLPTVRRKSLAGGVLYRDAQFDDARLLIDIASEASARGAAVLNYAKVSRIEKPAEDSLWRLEFEDVDAGKTYNVTSRAVINAAGIFSDEVRRLVDPDPKQTLTFSRGIHLVLGREFLPADSAMLIPQTSDGRVLFCIPWRGRTLVGTTETPVDSPELEPTAIDSEIDFIITAAGEYLDRGPNRGDIMSVFAGIRPLIKDQAAKNTAGISRSHALYLGSSGLITITGGKWTTYRKMAEDAVDKAVETFGLSAGKCATAELTITPPIASRDLELLHAGLPCTRGDVIRAVRQEMALTLEDTLARRTGALFLNAKAAIEAAPATADIMAKELRKNEDWKAAQITEFIQIAENYLAHARADRD